jgi:uncharacterized membrane protein YtjA (UPF0391 family)
MGGFVRMAIVAAVAGSAGLAAASVPVAKRVTTAAPVVLVAVDTVTVSFTDLYVSGVVEGEAQASEWLVSFGSSGASALDACLRLATAAMAKPGAYRLELSARYDGATSSPVCRLARAQP